MITIKRKHLIVVTIALVLVCLLTVPLFNSVAERSQRTVITIGNIAEAAENADFMCDGVADNVQWQAALNALPATGGTIKAVATGNFNFAATVTRAIDNVVIEGMGRGTYFANNGAVALFTAGGNNWVFRDLRTDAGSITMGATTGWTWQNVTINATYYAYRSPYGISSLADTDVTNIDIGDIALTDSGADDRLLVDTYAIPRTATLVVAASDASAASIAQADYVCDGTADDVQIQAAIDAAPGGIVHLTEGTFNITTTLTITTDGTRLIGESNHQNTNCGTILYLTAFADCTMIEITGARCSIEDMMLNGRKAQQNPGNWYGIHVKTGSSAFDFRAKGVYVQYSYSHGWYLDETIPWLDNCLSEECGGDGVNVGTNGGRAMINGFYSYLNSGNGFELAGGRNTIIGSYSVADGKNGIEMAGSPQNIIMGNHIYDASQLANNTYRAIRIHTGTAINNTIVGNYILATAANKIRYGIEEESPASKNIVTNNHVIGAVTQNIYITSDSTLVKNNMGWIEPSEIRTASGSLTAGNANAICFAWNNLEAQDILIKKVVIEVTTGGGTVGSHLDVGIADDAAGTNRGTEFFDDLLLNNVQINDSWVGGDGGTQTKWVFCQDTASATDDWIVGQILDANAASLVGKYYIEYVGR